MACMIFNFLLGTSDDGNYFERIRILGDCHVELCQMTDEMSANFGFSMLFLFLLIIINLIAFSNWTLVSAVRYSNIHLAARNACWVILYLALIYFLLYNGTKLIDEVSMLCIKLNNIS